jgi:hypothetical protein
VLLLVQHDLHWMPLLLLLLLMGACTVVLLVLMSSDGGRRGTKSRRIRPDARVEVAVVG